MAKKNFSFTIGMQFTIEDLKDEMDQQFVNLYNRFYLNQNFNQEEFINKSLVFFNESKNNFEAHDSFFNNFTILTEHFLKEGKLFEVEKIWRFALDIAYKWEQENSGNRIHKGSPYHFLGVTYLLFKDYMTGFLLIHQALEEDKKTKNRDHPYTPGYYFVTLNYDKSVYGQELLKNIADYLNLKILEYKKIRNGSLTIDEFKKKFLEQEKNIDIIFSFVYLLFNLNKLETGIRREFIKNDFASLFEVGLILDLCLIIDSPHSTLKCNKRRSCFKWCFKTQTLSGSVINQRFDISNLMFSNFTKVSAFWQIPSDNAINMLIRATLP